METMDTTPTWRRAGAEFVGTGLLVSIVVGSGIAAQRLSPGDTGVQLLENSFATALGLAVLIIVFESVSGSHFNPLVTLADRVLGGGLSPARLSAYTVAQVTGAIAGVVLANAMFDTATAVSVTDRLSTGRVLGEIVATAGLVLVIFSLARSGRTRLVGPAVGAYIGAAYWFTSSTSFANPAVTVGRIFTSTFAGIAPLSALVFVLAQLVGAGVGVALVLIFFPPPRKATP
ncbi:MAG: aquaporin family protein [Microbacterium sp.]|nr:aquaporin family protein [Microbacterium sp.]